MARQLTNNYNNSLKISGINATQIPNLALLNIYNQIEISKISDRLITVYDGDSFEGKRVHFPVGDCQTGYCWR